MGDPARAITAERTWEDPSVTSPQERERLFGQEDHLRAYGPDYVDRLAERALRWMSRPWMT